MLGKPWRKSIQFLGINLDLGCLSRYRCLGAPLGLCRRTGLPHQQLSGKDEDGVFWTKVAEPYPAKLCQLVA